MSRALKGLIDVDRSRWAGGHASCVGHQHCGLSAYDPSRSSAAADPRVSALPPPRSEPWPSQSVSVWQVCETGHPLSVALVTGLNQALTCGAIPLATLAVTAAAGRGLALLAAAFAAQVLFIFYFYISK